MAKDAYIRLEVPIPDNVELRVEGKVVLVRGPLGQLKKDFSYAKKVNISRENNRVVLETYFARKRDKALIGMLAGKIKSMIEGVLRGYRYRMYIVYAHFPMNLKVSKDEIIVENFLGRRDIIRVKIVEGATVKVLKDEVIIEGLDKEAVAQTAANLHQATKLRGKRRLAPHGRAGGPGVLDGIYLYKVEHLR
ncbi:MAG: 50S ribosomal protein L6 [Thermoprotei archaeon]|nr:MAG: 50S ribosomal protein L6 [Thermoprotei archaeon]RLE90287.1 MAG: 50S ribosomal protein L6 [Thermoprotei archaeon]